MIIKVTQEDINNGIKKACWSCPIALAAQRSFKTTKVQVVKNIIIINNKTYRLTKIAKTFITDFDNDVKVQPFSFEIES